MTMIAGTADATQSSSARGSYEDLVALFADWRAFERPPMRDGAPDYTATTFARRHQELKAYQARLAAIDPSAWPVEQRVDYELVRAEMNGLDFDIRVLKPWERDPAFYASVFTAQSDTPAHEGPTHHALVELWTYSFPLTPEAAKKLASRAVDHSAAAGAGASSIWWVMRGTCGSRASARCRSSSKHCSSSSSRRTARIPN